jgi:hypothetical protein
MLAYPILRRALAAAAAAAVAGALASSASAALAPPPSKRPQPFPTAQNDGCQRSVGGLVTGNSPAWVYVHKDRRPRFVKGTSYISHFYGNDLSTNHLGYDYNVNIKTDAPYANLVGGDPAAGTGNFTPTQDPGERVGTLHSEWENEVMPMFFVPSERDRVQAWGAWIWDCAHWAEDFNDNGAADPGEKTEFHSFRGLVVERRNRYGGKHGETQADAFISSQGTRAHASAECALKHHPINGDQYDPGYSTCLQNPANARQPVNDMNYSFDVKAPKKPFEDAQLTYSVISKIPGGPPETITKTPTGIHVTVLFKGFGGSTGVLRYGKRFIVGWKDAEPKGTHLQVRLGTLQIIHSLDPGPPNSANHQTSTAPGEYVMFLEVNGTWFALNRFIPGLTSVDNGETFNVGRTVDLYLPPHKNLRVYGQGWECDVGGELFPCPKGRHEGALFNDPIGDKIDRFTRKQAPGSHVLRSTTGDWTLSYDVVEK